MVNNLKYNCVFGGGGIRGMCYIGAVNALFEQKVEIGSIAGSSVGAVFASLLAVGYNTLEIKKLFMDFNFNMFRDLNINLFQSDISLSKGEIFLDWLREKTGKKFWGDDFTKNKKVLFKDIDKDLYILTVDLNTNTPFIFSKKTTPDEEIAFAVRASAGLPGLMKPVNYKEMMLVDGDLIKSWPAWKLYPELNLSPNRILEFRLEGSRDGSDIKNPMDYVNSIINAIWFFSTENVYNSYSQNDKYDYIIIDTKDLILFDFTIDKALKEKLIDKGYIVTKNYFEKTLKEKQSNLKTIYAKILKKTKILNRTIEQNNPKNALIVINEILSTMKEDTVYIDIFIYDKIKQLKQEILLNIKQCLFITQMKNVDDLKKMSKFIIFLLEEKLKSNNC